MEHEMSDRNGHTPDDAIERIGTLRDILQAEVKKEGSE